MESPSMKKSLKPKIRTPFSPKMTSGGSASPHPVRRRSNPSLPVYAPQPRIFNSRKKMTAEMAILQDKIAAAEKAKAVLVQANTKLHLEFRTLSEELNSQSAKTLKRNEKLAEKTKTYRLESARMKAQITHLESELVETAKTRWRQRLDGANF